MVHFSICNVSFCRHCNRNSMQARFQKPQKNVSHLAIPYCNFHLKNNAHEIFIGNDFHKARKILKDLQRCDANAG